VEHVGLAKKVGKAGKRKTFMRCCRWRTQLLPFMSLSSPISVCIYTYMFPYNICILYIYTYRLVHVMCVSAYGVLCDIYCHLTVTKFGDKHTRRYEASVQCHPPWMD